MIGIESVVVGLGEMYVTADASAVLVCLGLGSCVALCAYDPFSRLGGIAHIVLPRSSGKTDGRSPRYADAAVSMLVAEMRRNGAAISRVKFKIAGGAQMSIAPGTNGLFKIGARNLEAVRAALAEVGASVAAADVGGNCGRTVRLFVASGKVTVTTAAAGTREI